jgi:uncharacterized protein
VSAVSRELQIDVGEAALAATLTVPPRRTSAPALVALHGAESGTRAHRLLRHLHEALPPHGIAVLTFDRRGEGESTGEPSRGRLDLQASDALAAVERLAAEPEIDASRIGLWGFSQGAWVAPIAATRSVVIRFLVLIGAPGVTPKDQMLYGVAVHLRRAGYDETIVERVLDLRRRVDAHAHGEADDAELRSLLEAAAQEPWWPLAYLPRQPFADESKRSWIDEMDFEPEPVFASVRAPALLFYGADEEWTPVEPSIAAWRRARGAAVEIVCLPECGHDPLLGDGSVAPDYERTMLAWLAKRVGL